MPGKIQIAYGISILCFKTRRSAALVEDAIVINDDRIIHAVAAGQPARPLFELMDKAEVLARLICGRRPRYRYQVWRARTAPEHGMIKSMAKVT